MSPFDIRLVAYTPGAGKIGNVDALSIDATLAFCDAPTLKVKVSSLTLSVLPDVVELALEYWHPTLGDWVEPDDARFIAKEGEGDDKDAAGVKTITGVGLWHYMMSKSVVAVGASGADPDFPDGHRPFADATPGAIMKTFLDEAKTRGWGSFLSFDFTHDLDSDGVAWAEGYDIAYKPGVSTWLVLSNLADQALAEYSTSGRILHLYRPDRGVDRSLGNAPVRVGNAAVNMPVKTSIDDLITDVIVFGENGLSWEFTDGATNVLGRLEGAIQQGGVSRPGTAAKLASSTLQDGSQVKRQITASEDTLTASSLPFADYVSGDWLLARVQDTDESLRVMEIQIRKGKSITVDTVLNDRFIDLLARTAKRTNGILGGTSAGGTGVPVAGVDTRAPKVPIGVVATSEGYWTEDGMAQSSLAVRWTAVTQDTDDVDLNVDRYELWWRPQTSDPDDATLLGTVRSATFGSNPYEPGSKYFIKVRALTGHDVAGAFSAEVPITMVAPVALLDPPTDPVVTAKLGVVSVVWDGKLTSGGTIFDTPGQFKHTYAAISSSEMGTYNPIGQPLGRAGGMTLAGLTRGSTVWVKLFAVDTRGGVSAPSGAVPVVVVGVEGPDLEANSVTANAIAVGAVQAEHISLGARMPLGESNQRVPSPPTDSSFWAKVFDGTIDLIAPPASAPQSFASAVVGGIRLTPNSTTPGRAWLTARQPVPVSRALNCAFLASGVTSLVSTNLALNPRALSYGADMGSPNYGGVYSLYRENATGTAPPSHPELTSGLVSGVLAGHVTNELMSAYNLDGQANSATPRRMGAWVLVIGAGYSVRMGISSTPVAVPSSVWTFVAADVTEPGYNPGGCYIYHADSSPTGAGDFAIVTGIVSLAGNVSPTDSFDGSTSPIGDTVYLWTGAPNASTSTKTAPSASIRVASWDVGGTVTLSPLPNGQVWSFPADAVEYAACVEQAAGAGVSTVVTATVFEAIGNATSGHQYVRITQQGVEATDDSGNASIRLGTWDANFLSIYQLNALGQPITQATIDDDGVGTFSTVNSAGDVSVLGTPLVGGFAGARVNGGVSNLPMLDRVGRGTQFVGDLGPMSDGIATATMAQGLGSASTELPAGRLYEVFLDMSGLARWESGTPAGNLGVEVWIGSSQQDLLNPNGIKLSWGVLDQSITNNVYAPFISTMSGPVALPSGKVYVLVRLSQPANRAYRVYATGVSGTPIVVIKDAGPNTGLVNAGDISTRVTAGSPPPPPAQQTRYFDASWSEAHDSGGNTLAGSSNLYADGRMVQGGGTGGARVSYIGFPALNLSSNLILSMRIRLRNRHTSSSAGATVQFGANGLGGAPGALVGASNRWDDYTAKGEDKWYGIPSSLYPGFAAGALRCISLGDRASGSSGNYGIFDSVSDVNALGGGAVNPSLEITYR